MTTLTLFARWLPSIVQQAHPLRPDFRRSSRILACATSDITGGETCSCLRAPIGYAKLGCKQFEDSSAAPAGANDGLIAPAGSYALDETFVLKLLKPSRSCGCAAA